MWRPLSSESKESYLSLSLIGFLSIGFSGCKFEEGVKFQSEASPQESSKCLVFHHGGRHFDGVSASKSNVGYYDLTYAMDYSNFYVKSFDEGCAIQSYEIAVVAGDHFILENESSAFQSYAVSWTNHTILSGHQKDVPLTDNFKYSICVRAIAKSGDKSAGYCQSFVANPPVLVTTPIDTSPPSDVGNVVASFDKLTDTVIGSWSSSSDPESGISRYLVTILDSNLNVVSSIYEVPAGSTNKAISPSNLIRDRDYYFAVVAENSRGLQSGIQIYAVHIPSLYSVTLAWGIFKRSSPYQGSTCTSSKVMTYGEALSVSNDGDYLHCPISVSGSSVLINCGLDSYTRYGGLDTLYRVPPKVTKVRDGSLYYSYQCTSLYTCSIEVGACGQWNY